MMVKVTRSGDQPGLLHGEPPTSLVKVASGGMGFNDFRTLVKRAGHYIATAIRDLTFYPGEVPTHSIALGADEWFGGNRNGDLFKEAACKKYYKTFEKYARCYRDHQNKQPEKSYGGIRLAIYNDAMHRIELIQALNGNKTAAARNRGLVADKELAILEKGGSYDSSMACQIPFDVCSVCGNHAKTRAEYCTGEDEGGHCKGGGLMNRIGTVLEDGTQVCAENPDPRWFDNSMVGRHADRTAAVNGIIEKTASGRIIGGAERAELLGVTAPWSIAFDIDGGPATALAIKLAGWEQTIAAGGFSDTLHLGLLDAPQSGWTRPPGRADSAAAALAMNAAVLPVEGFLAATAGEFSKSAADAVRARLPGVYTRMLDDGSLEAAVASSLRPAVGIPSVADRAWAKSAASCCSMSRDSLRQRALKASVRGHAPRRPRVPAGSPNGPAEKLAREYAAHVLAVLQATPTENFDSEFACRMAVSQNYL